MKKGDCGCMWRKEIDGECSKKGSAGGGGRMFLPRTLCPFQTPMQEVTPKVVAMAVSTVMMMLRIFPQMFLFSIVFVFVLRVDGFVVWLLDFSSADYADEK